MSVMRVSGRWLEFIIILAFIFVRVGAEVLVRIGVRVRDRVRDRDRVSRDGE